MDCTTTTDVDIATMSDESMMDLAAETSCGMAALAGLFVRLITEVARTEAWRTEGATSLEAWIVERCGLSIATSRAYAHVADRLKDLPYLSAALSAGELTFDKVRAVADIATPQNEGDLVEQAAACTVRQLHEVARTARGAPRTRDEVEFEARSVHFNDGCCTMTAQFPSEKYAEVKGRLEESARKIQSDGETPWDQRLCDALLDQLRGGHAAGGAAADYIVVAHVPLQALVDETSELPGELEHLGLISGETVRRIACDATVAVAVDDDAGHTMYEGRAERFPTDAQRREIMRRDRHCRFPSCTNVTFTNVHHIKTWGAGGLTDLDNMVLLCEFHHHRAHSRGWSMSGDPNEELTFVAPTGHVMTSRPSPQWTTVSAT